MVVAIVFIIGLYLDQKVSDPKDGDSVNDEEVETEVLVSVGVTLGSMGVGVAVLEHVRKLVEEDVAD